MSTNTRMFTRFFRAALATALSAAWATGAYAADLPSPGSVAAQQAAAQKPIEELQELDEIWVRGKWLSGMIEGAEDDFFLLYNRLNKDSQYDVHCGRMALNAGSMIMIRKCTPGFIVYNYTDALGRGIGTIGCSSESSGTCGGFTDAFGYSAPAFPAFVPPPPEALLMAKGPAYAANVVKVVKSDPRLLEKVKDLGILYKDMELVQGHYVKVKGDGPPARASQRGSTNRGPRAL